MVIETTGIPNQDDFFNIAGRIIRKWAEMDHWLLIFISRALNTDQTRAEIVMASTVMLRAQLELAERLGETYLDVELLERFRGLLKRIRNLSKKRNEIAHRLLMQNEDGTGTGVFVLQFKPDVGVSYGFNPVTMKDLRLQLDAVKKLHSDFVDFLNDSNGRMHVEARTHRTKGASAAFQPKQTRRDVPDEHRREGERWQ